MHCFALRFIYCSSTGYVCWELFACEFVDLNEPNNLRGTDKDRHNIGRSTQNSGKTMSGCIKSRWIHWTATHAYSWLWANTGFRKSKHIQCIVLPCDWLIVRAQDKITGNCLHMNFLISINQIISETQITIDSKHWAIDTKQRQNNVWSHQKRMDAKKDKFRCIKMHSWNKINSKEQITICIETKQWPIDTKQRQILTHQSINCKANSIRSNEFW